MHYQRVAVLFVVSVLFLTFLYSAHEDNAVAGIVPTATPRNNRMMETASSKVYLPVVFKSPPPPPSATTSRYVVTTTLSILWNEGCNQARAGESGVVVLDFGTPAYDSTTHKYGTILAGGSRPFVSVDTIWSLTAEFLQGYADASCNPTGKHIYLAVGTNNYGTQVTREHGIAWAQLVENVHQTIIYPPSLESMVTAAGAIDAEVDWNSATTTRAWVDGYKDTTSKQYYNFGNCAGCNYPTGAPSNGWTWNDVWYISYGVLPAYPLPEIYARSGTHANQWYTMSVYTYNTYGYRMRFKGSFTQWQACQGNTPRAIECRNLQLDNTPSDGWTQLYNKLNSDSRTAQDLPWSTDVTWAQ